MEKHADHSRATADNLCMRTESFDKTFIKSFCVGFQRALAQASFGRGMGQTAPRTGGYTYLGVTEKQKTDFKGRAFEKKRKIILWMKKNNADAPSVEEANQRSKTSSPAEVSISATNV